MMLPYWKTSILESDESVANSCAGHRMPVLSFDRGFSGGRTVVPGLLAPAARAAGRSAAHMDSGRTFACARELRCLSRRQAGGMANITPRQGFFARARRPAPHLRRR